MWDHAKVVEMSSWWQEAGLGNTSSGKFLKSLADTGRPPFGRGHSWLLDLMNQGDPRPFVNLGRDLEKMIPNAGSDAETLARMVANLKAGYPPKDWYKDFISRLHSKMSSSAMRDPTPEEKRIALGISIYKSGQSPFYWSRKPGTSNKIDKITNTIQENRQIYEDDINYLFDNFKSLVKILKREDIDGKLVWVKASKIYDEKLRNLRLTEETIPCIVCGPAFVSPTWRKPAIEAIAECSKVVILWDDSGL